MSSFAMQLKAFEDKTKAQCDDIVGRVVSDIASRLDMRSPVGDQTKWKHRATIEDNGDLTQHGLLAGYVGGRFRGNWQLGINFVPQGETGRIDPSGSATLAAIVAEIPTQAAGLVFSLANNVPYAQALEDGHSGQAPVGLVGLTVAEFSSIVTESVAGAKR